MPKLKRHVYDPLDRRQRLAATILMTAVDLPQPMSDFAKLVKQAALLTPGCFADEVLLDQGRRCGQERAKALIEEMLVELA